MQSVYSAVYITHRYKNIAKLRKKLYVLQQTVLEYIKVTLVVEIVKYAAYVRRSSTDCKQRITAKRRCRQVDIITTNEPTPAPWDIPLSLPHMKAVTSC